MPVIILASKSAARSAVLRGAGVVFETADSGVDEDLTKANMLAHGARAVAQALAEEKALMVSKARGGLVIGADQTLEFQTRLFDKVADRDAARQRLRMLRGEPHSLHSAVVVAKDGVPIWRETVSATLTMRDFSDEFLEHYLEVEGDNALGSVGCYRLEGLGAQLFSDIRGDYFAILGLPLLGLLDLLRRQGAVTA